MKPSEKCYAIIRHFEGCRLGAYKCPRGLWTIGYGNTRYPDGRAVKQGDVITNARAVELLIEIVTTFAISVDKMVKRHIPQHQFDALVSFAYNCGIGNLEKSTLIRKVNAGAPAHEIEQEFIKWNKSGGNVLDGLTRRRRAEAYLFVYNDLKFS